MKDAAEEVRHRSSRFRLVALALSNIPYQLIVEYSSYSCFKPMQSRSIWRRFLGLTQSPQSPYQPVQTQMETTKDVDDASQQSSPRASYYNPGPCGDGSPAVTIQPTHRFTFDPLRCHPNHLIHVQAKKGFMHVCVCKTLRFLVSRCTEMGERIGEMTTKLV